MITHSSKTAPSGRNSPSFGIGSFLFIVVLTVIPFLLAESMVRHRFHEGGQINRSGSVSP